MEIEHIPKEERLAAEQDGGESDGQQPGDRACQNANSPSIRVHTHPASTVRSIDLNHWRHQVSTSRVVGQ